MKHAEMSNHTLKNYSQNIVEPNIVGLIFVNEHNHSLVLYIGFDLLLITYT